MEVLQKGQGGQLGLVGEEDGDAAAMGDGGEGAEVQDPEQQRILEELYAEEDAAAAELEMEDQEAEREAEDEDVEELKTVATTKVHDPLYLDLPLSDLPFKFAVSLPSSPISSIPSHIANPLCPTDNQTAHLPSRHPHPGPQNLLLPNPRRYHHLSERETKAQKVS